MKNFSCYQILGCVLITVIALAAAVLLYTQTLTDNDIWFTMAYGRYFLEQGTIIPDHGVFSWTPAANSTIYCSWIPGILFYLLFDALGMTSLFALRYLCLAAFILLALSFAEKKNLTSVLAGALIILCGAVMVTSGIRIKAEIFSFVFMTVMVWTWFRIKSLQETDDRGGALFYVYPALMLLWVNSHGGFIFGLAFLGIMAVGETVNRITRSPAVLGPRAMKHLFISLPLSLLAVLVTPYGWRYPGQLISMLILSPEGYRHHFQGIFEYQNIFFPAIRHLLYIEGLAVALAILIPLAILHLKNRRPDWAILLANALFILLYVRYIRTTYFWGILFVFSALYLLKSSLKPHGDLLNSKPAGIIIRAVMVCVLLVFSARVSYQAWTSPDLGLRVNYYSPMAEAGFIRDTFPQITRMGNEYNSGAYLIWSLWPGKKVLIDSRYFPYAAWYDEYQDFMTTPDTKRKDAFLKKYPCDLWVLNYDSPALQHFLSSTDWRLVHYGPSACVFLSGRVSHAKGHTVSESVYDTAFYQASFIARFALDMGDYQVARRLLLRLEPRPFYGFEKLYAVMALLEAGDFTLRRNEFGVARDLLARATQIDPDSYEARMMMGRVLMKMNRFEEAIQSFRQAMRLQDNSDEAHSRMAGALMQSHRVYEAAREYSSALKINPLNAEARTDLGVVMERMKGLNNEIAQMHQALKERPADREGLLRLARHLAMAGQYENAITFFQKASDLSPEDAETYYHIACMYSMLDRVDESEKWMERAMTKGFKDLQLLHRDIDLENFRKSDFYKKLSRKS